MSEDYYDILGIGKNADPQSIRKAYRREVKKSHPDSSGSGNSSERFRKVEEAYETLGDSRKREAYDQRQRRKRSSAAFNRSRTPSGGAPVSERPPFSRSAESAESVFGFPSGFPGAFPFGLADTGEPLLEVLLSPREASEGVQIPVEVPVSLPCPECSAEGLWRRFFCFTCGGTGTIHASEQLVLQIPPGIRHGREYVVDTAGLTGASVRIRVRVLVE